MKTIIILLIALHLSLLGFAQDGEINYKAVIKDDSGNIVSDQPVKIRFSILDGTSNSVYQETHEPTTDANGIINLNIGEGMSTDIFTDINWGSDTHSLKTEIDLEVDDTFVDLGTTAFKAVPYALSSADNTWVKDGVNTYTTSEKTGVNTDTPEETLDVNGRIKVGDVSPTSTNTEGAIRYNVVTKDFEGWNGSAWLSLTKSNNGWGNQSVNENDSKSGENFAYDNGILAILYSDAVTIANYTNGIFSNEQTVYEDIGGPKFNDQIALHNNKLLVSAYKQTPGDPSSLRYYVYVFENLSGTWVKQSIISDPENSSSTGFAFSLDIHNDLVLISAPYYNSNAGRVYLFKLSSGNWPLIKTFQGALPTENFGFGQSISISGNNICIAEVGNDKVYLYEDSNSVFGWTNAGTFTAPSGEVSFGKAIDLDNNKLAVVGYDDTSFIYEKTNGVWPATPSNTINQVGGTRVKIKGDYLMIMKNLKVHLFEFNNSSWGEIAQLSSSEGYFHPFNNLELTNDNITIVNVFSTPKQINFYSRN